MRTLEVDPIRREEMPEDATGIFVRARDEHGKFVNADISILTKESLHAWLKSRGGDNVWAENVVAILLGYGHFEVE
jgi:hypothetical protein